MKFKISYFASLIIAAMLMATNLFATNNCLNFDGSNDFIKVVNQSTPYMHIGASYTFEAWFKSGPVGNYARVILTTWKINTIAQTYAHIELVGPGSAVGYSNSSDNGRIRFLHRSPAAQGGGANVVSPQNGPRYDDNLWHHVAAVYNAASDKMFLYIDGSEVATQSGVSGEINDDYDFFIGANGSEGHGGTSGNVTTRRYLHLIDEVRIWNYARTAQDIVDNFCSELTLPVNGLVHYYPMNEGSGTTTADVVGGKTAQFAGNQNINETIGPDWFFPGFPASLCNLQSGAPLGPVLWHDNEDPNGDLSALTNPLLFDFWKDKTATAEDATQNDNLRKPKYQTTAINGNPGVLFEPGRNITSGHGWGEDDAMGSLYNAEITSAEAIDVVTNPNWTGTSKTLFIVFKTPDLSVASWQNRQVIFEAGETTSGFNVYIDNEALCFGMWNRYERKFIKTNPQQVDIYDLAPNTVYLAILEFNATNKKFRGIMSRSAGESYTLYNNVSPAISFSGITSDPDDNSSSPSTGIGGEVLGTRFHDYNIRTNNYAHTFHGWLGDILLYNQVFNETQIANILNYLNSKYNSSFSYPDPNTIPAPKAGDWQVFEETEKIEFDEVRSSVKPNPTGANAIFELYMPTEAMVTIELINMMGERVHQIHSGSQSKGLAQYSINSVNLPSGTYFIRAIAGNSITTQSLIINK